MKLVLASFCHRDFSRVTTTNYSLRYDFCFSSLEFNYDWYINKNRHPYTALLPLPLLFNKYLFRFDNFQCQ